MAIFAYTGWMAFSGDGKYKNSVNYVKGMEALQDSNYAEAMKYLNKAIHFSASAALWLSAAIAD